MVRSKFKNLLLTCFATLMAVCVAFGCISVQSTQSASADDVASNTANVGDGADIYNSATRMFNKNSLKDLFIKLGKGVEASVEASAGAIADTTSYSALKSVYSNPVTAKNLSDANEGDLFVRFGDKLWTVTYLSTEDNGDLIATLWYAENDVTSGFSSEWLSGTSDVGYEGYTKHSNHYGGSYIRAVTLGNGGDYYDASGKNKTSNDDVSTVTVTEEDVLDSPFYKFAQGELAEYLVAPNDVSWQQIEENTIVSWRQPNETLVDDPVNNVTDKWYSNSENLKNAQADPLYNQWGNDKVWLPSLSETSKSDKVDDIPGIWGTTLNQILITTDFAWLRSGYRAYASYVLMPSGIDFRDTWLNTINVRPAIHLNLKSAAKAAGVADCTATLSYDVGSAAGGAAISPTLTVKDGEYELTMGSEGYGTPTYTITSGAEYATINSATGELRPLESGSVTVQVTTAQTDLYASATATATVTVEKPDEPEPATPAEPTAPDGQEPATPAEPDKPDGQEPATPAEPDKPNGQEPSAPAEQEPENTGCGNTDVLIFVIVVIVVACVICVVASIIIKRRKNK